MKTRVYRELASLVLARKNCIKFGNTEWEEKHEERIETLIKNYLPYGSGFDSGTSIDLEKSTENELIFYTEFHHMSDAGYYTGWTEHTVTITPSLLDHFDIRITGRNRNGIKDYIADIFNAALMTEIESTTGKEILPESVIVLVESGIVDSVYFPETRYVTIIDHDMDAEEEYHIHTETTKQIPESVKAIISAYNKEE